MAAILSRPWWVKQCSRQLFTSLFLTIFFSTLLYITASPSIEINTLRTRQNGHHFTDGLFKCIFLNENLWTSIKTSLKFVSKSPINNYPALVQIMAWRQTSDKALSLPMMVRLPTLYASLGLNELRQKLNRTKIKEDAKKCIFMYISFFVKTV